MLRLILRSNFQKENSRSHKIFPPANRLEKLSGKLKDFYSIRINDQWRIIFKWNAGNAFEVEIIDYH